MVKFNKTKIIIRDQPKKTRLICMTWMQKHADVVDRFRVNTNQVKMIFVDETLIQIDGKDFWLWIAYEPDMDLRLMMHISGERTILVCYQFFKELQKRFGTRLASVYPKFPAGLRDYLC